METENMEERLGKLEEKLARTERRYRLVFVGLGTAVVIWIVAVALSCAQAGQVIRAEKFELVDRTGKVRAALQVVENEPGLTMFDEAGEVCVMLVAAKDGSALVLHGERGEPRAILRVNKEGTGLTMVNDRGKASVLVSTLENAPGLSLWDVNGQTVWRAP